MKYLYNVCMADMDKLRIIEIINEGKFHNEILGHCSEDAVFLVVGWDLMALSTQIRSQYISKLHPVCLYDYSVGVGGNYLVVSWC